MSVIIKEVLTKNDLKKWIRFPLSLYKNSENFTPFLESEEIGNFTKTVNPAYEFCDTKLYLAYKNGKIVGRIGAIINHAANKKWNSNAIRFTRFDFIDDYEVSSALFNKVIDYGKEYGLKYVMGPIGFTDLDHEGMLIEGFDELNMSITFYNFPYYIDHMEKLGLKKDIDWMEFLISVPNEINPKFKKMSEYLKTRNGYQLITYTDKKEVYKDAFEAFSVVDEAFSVLYGTVPLTPAIIKKTIDDNIPVINLKYVCMVKDKDGKIVGFALMVPSIVKALKKSKGRLFPFGAFRMLKALNGKNERLEMYLIAVDPEHQAKGVPAIIIDHMLQVCIDNGVKYCETGPELETNDKIQSLWKTFDARNHKRRRCWKKEITD